MATKQAIISSTKNISKRLVGAYVLDWIAIVCFAAIAGGIAGISPHYHAFSVLDLSISYPLLDETISNVALAFIGGVIPAIIIFVVVLVFVPGPATWRTMSRTTIIQWKLWEWNSGWLGLALTHATSQLIVQGTKNVAGKPRPDMLARCMPDLATLASHRVGGYGQDISASWIMVDQNVCTQTNRAVLDDGFRSFPSGHATTSWAGMLFLSLWLASKFQIWFPLLFLVYIPLGVAIYITGTRFFEYYHFGFDLISGAVIGIVSAWFSFRWYNLPLGRSAGWSWGPRSRDRAFAVGIGRKGFVSDDPTTQAKPEDIEMGSSSYVTAPPQTDDVNGRWGQDPSNYHEIRSSAGDSERPGFHKVQVTGQRRG